MKNDKVVYEHYRKDTGEIFYVGIGDKYRPNSKSSRNPYWHHIVDLVGYDIKVVKENLSWEEACEHEKYLISYYGRKDLGNGSLVNLTDGGDGNVGYVYSEEQIIKNRETQTKISGKKIYLYELYTDKVIIFNSKRDAIRFLVESDVLSARTKLRNTMIVGGEYLIMTKKITKEEKIKILYDSVQYDMKVLKMSMDFSEVIEEYSSLREAQRKNNGGQIGGVLNKNNPKRKSSLGFRWVYKVDYVYKGIDYLKDLYGFKYNVFTYTEELINDCLNPNLTYEVISEKHKGVSTGTIGNIKKNPEKYLKKIGLKSYIGNHK